MDDISEAGLDLELNQFRKRLDSRLVALGWNPKAARRPETVFELSAKRAGPGRIRLVVDATLPEDAAREVMAIVIERGLPATVFEAD
jgi:hypothetical protein